MQEEQFICQDIYVLQEIANYTSLDVLFLDSKEAEEYAKSRAAIYREQGIGWNADLYRIQACRYADDEDSWSYEELEEDGVLLKTFCS